MAKILHISDAVALAFHAMAYLANLGERRVTTRTMAKKLGVSEAHLAKVMQRLEQTGWVRGKRGPNGGFRLGQSPKKITLRALYETMEGPLVLTQCLLGNPVCDGNCALGEFIRGREKEVLEKLSRTRLHDFAGNLSSLSR